MTRRRHVHGFLFITPASRPQYTGSIARISVDQYRDGSRFQLVIHRATDRPVLVQISVESLLLQLLTTAKIARIIAAPHEAVIHVDRTPHSHRRWFGPDALVKRPTVRTRAHGVPACAKRLSRLSHRDTGDLLYNTSAAFHDPRVTTAAATRTEGPTHVAICQRYATTRHGNSRLHQILPCTMDLLRPSPLVPPCCPKHRPLSPPLTPSTAWLQNVHRRIILVELIVERRARCSSA